jgi:hypothetical protein
VTITHIHATKKSEKLEKKILKLLTWDIAHIHTTKKK